MFSKDIETMWFECYQNKELSANVVAKLDDYITSKLLLFAKNKINFDKLLKAFGSNNFDVGDLFAKVKNIADSWILYIPPDKLITLVHDINPTTTFISSDAIHVSARISLCTHTILSKYTTASTSFERHNIYGEMYGIIQDC